MSYLEDTNIVMMDGAMNRKELQKHFTRLQTQSQFYHLTRSGGGMGGGLRNYSVPEAT